MLFRSDASRCASKYEVKARATDRGWKIEAGLELVVGCEDGLDVDHIGDCDQVVIGVVVCAVPSTSKVSGGKLTSLDQLRMCEVVVICSFRQTS